MYGYNEFFFYYFAIGLKIFNFQLSVMSIYIERIANSAQEAFLRQKLITSILHCVCLCIISAKQ